MGCTCKCTCGWVQNKSRLRSDRRKVWSEEKFLDALRKLNAAGIRLNALAIERDRSKKTKEVLSEHLGYAILPRTLYDASRRHRLDWAKLCDKAGVVTSSFKRNEKWSHEKVLAVIKQLFDAGYDVNCKAMRFDKSADRKAFILKVSGEAVTGSGVYKRGCLRFGSWDATLIAAGLNPKNIKNRRVRRSKSRFAHLPIRFEMEETDAGFRSVGYVGFEPKVPDEELEMKTLIKGLNSLVKALPLERRRIAKQVIDTLLNDSTVDTLDDAIETAAKRAAVREKFISEASEIFLVFKHRLQGRY